MSTLIKRIRLFKNNNTPIIYTTINKKVITPTPRLTRRNTRTGLLTTKELTNAKTNDERAYVREIAKYYLVIGKLKEVRKLVTSMRPADRQLFFNMLTVPQLVEYFVSRAGPLARVMAKKMNKRELVTMAANDR